MQQIFILITYLELEYKNKKDSFAPQMLLNTMERGFRTSLNHFQVSKRIIEMKSFELYHFGWRDKIDSVCDHLTAKHTFSNFA